MFKTKLHYKLVDIQKKLTLKSDKTAYNVFDLKASTINIISNKLHVSIF